ncbi:hypothetical protein H4Q26_002299, partial [Puccinia striiformis f. sp. tritici PST-130]
SDPDHYLDHPHSARLLTRGQPPTYHRSPTRERVLPLISTGDWRSIYRTHPPIVSIFFPEIFTTDPRYETHPISSFSLLNLSNNDSTIDRQDINPPPLILIPTHRKQSLHMTPVENQDLIQHYLTLVKQQRADNPPPPPFVDPLTSDERLDRIIKNVLADQEAELDHKIFFNQSLRDYRSDKRMQTITRRDLLFKFMVHVTNKLINDPRPTLHSKDFDAVTFKKRFKALEKALNSDRLNSPQEKNNAATFNAWFEEYKAALIQAQEVEVQATQKGDKTIIPTSKILKLETRREPLNDTIPEVTGNFHLDKHLAKTSITDKPANKKEKTAKKKILPLESTLGDSSISSFTTEPYFEDLEPTTSLPSPFLKKITLEKELPIITDSESEEEKEPTYRSSSPVLEKIVRKKTLSILSDSEDEIDEG